MARWEPGARERLQIAALDLYASKGFEETTVAEIARSAGVTERTFYRHFADKREVLFRSNDDFVAPYLEGVAAAPADATPLEIVSGAIVAAAAFFDGRPAGYSRKRQLVITANPELQERELLKMAALASAIAAALRERGIAEPAATLAAESGVTVFRVSFELWLVDPDERPLAEIEAGVFVELGVVTASRSLRESPSR
jgi:AcrR family transcriptional regulator